MRAARIPWPALIGSLALSCLLPQLGVAQWSSPASDDPAADAARVGSRAATAAGQVRFVPPVDDAALPDAQAPAASQGVSPAVWTSRTLADPSGDFAITPDGEVVQTAYQSGRGGPVLRTTPATKGSLLGSMSPARMPSGRSAVPSHGQPFSRSSNVRSMPGQSAGPSPGGAMPARLSQSRTSAPAEPTPALEPTPTPATGNSDAERLLVAAHNRATTAATLEDLSRVIATCQRSLTVEPDGQAGQYARQLASWALNRRGQLLAGAGHTSEALRDFEDAIRLDPQRWRAIHNRGVLLAQAGRFEQAFDDFSHTIQLQPDYAKAYSNRAALLVVAGRLQQAADDYRQAIDLDPNLAVAHRGCGRCCHALGLLDEALRHFDAAVQLDPNNAYTVACRGDLLTDLGHYADAAADYDRAIQLDRRSIEACRGSAWLLATCPDRSVRNPELAVQRAETALRLDRKQEAVSYDTLAAALASAGRFRGAVQTARRAIELAPNDQRAVYQDRLQLYEHSQPFRIAPLRPAVQASYEH
jgi:tetratricopeptide (TPR) repeat protein